MKTIEQYKIKRIKAHLNKGKTVRIWLESIMGNSDFLITGYTKKGFSGYRNYPITCPYYTVQVSKKYKLN